MKQYVMSIYQPDGPPPPPDVVDLAKVMRDVDAVIEEIKGAGAWVFNGGLHPPTTATVVQIRDGELLTTDGPYLQAVHSDAATAAATDWRQIVALYDQLLALAPSPVVRLHRAVAVAEVDGPGAALAIVDGLAPEFTDYHLAHAIRADLLRRLGRAGEAALAYDAAIVATRNEAERDFLLRRRAALARP